jgi:hypothetical protein
MKTIYCSGLIVLFFSVLVVAPVRANPSVQVTPAFGVAWDQMYLWTLGLSVDCYLIKDLTITPEFYMANKKIGFTVSKAEDMGNFDPTFFLQPGMMVNFHQPSFFVGAGVVKSYQARNAWHYEGSGFPPTAVWKVFWTRKWKLKLNAGYKLSHVRFTAFFTTNFQDLGWFPTAVTNAYGVTIGYSFYGGADGT